MDKIVYLISVIILLMYAVLIKKKDEKINFILTLFISVVLLACYNIVIGTIMGLLNISICLNILTVINTITTIPIVYKGYKDREIQKYYIDLKDIIAIAIISFAALLVLNLNFGFPMNISFVEVDISNHYDMITSFYQTGKVSIGSIPGANINYGLFFKLFYNPLERFDGYYLLMICETIKLVFSGILFYFGIKTFITRKLSYCISVILSIIYMLSYPLNGLLCGFVYFQMAINIVSVIIIVLNYYKEISNRLKNILLFLLTFGLMFTYYILVPPVFLAIFIYELKQYKEDKKETIKNIFKILFMPSILGILWFLILPRIVNPQSTFNPAVHMGSDNAQAGYIFVSYFAMFIPFIPACIYNLYEGIKKKEFGFLNILFIATVLFCIVGVIGQQFGIVAKYYVMKPYYMLWLIMLTITGKVIFDLLNEKIEMLYKILINIVFFAYIIGVLYSVFIKGACNFKIFEYETESITSMYNIYRLNTGIVTHKTFDIQYTYKELEAIKQILKDFNGDEYIVFTTDVNNMEWIKKLLLIKGNDNTMLAPISSSEKQDKLIKQIIESEKQIYIICETDTFIKRYFTDFINKLDNTMNVLAKEGRVTIYTNK